MGGSTRAGATPPRPRRPAVRDGGPARRLAGAVVLVAVLLALGEAVLAAHLCARAVLADALASVEGLARTLPVAPSGLTPSRIVAPEFLTAVIVAPGGATSTVPGVPDGSRTLTEGTAAGPTVAQAVAAMDVEGSPRTLDTGYGWVAVAAAPGGRRLVVDLDDDLLRERTARLRDPMLLTIGLGAVAFGPLTWLAAGRSLTRDHARSRTQARTDRLTGLGNDLAFEEDLHDACRRVPASTDQGHGDADVSLVLLALQGLAGVRDADGRATASALQRVCAEAAAEEADALEGRAYRLDGDRLAILAVLAPAAAGASADRLRSAVVGRARPLTADAAAVTLSPRCPDAETLRIAAEEALARDREQRALVELFAAVGRRGEDPAGPVVRWVQLPRSAGDPPPGPRRGGGEGEPDIWDLDWFDDTP